ncbi:hypothetical protein B0O80DRAFT_497543 [Mortierella sp. GBAus27b]|nr:hypothetical protein BGX31_006199 [Mortierella sp. GBA43]KAI8356016.1 hypothetical protein B0O80DRAFT_497543 [Mortierella sp. GBAus27b]
MFDIPELNNAIYLQLERDDLARCAQVNKKWHKTLIPYVWNDITFLRNSCSRERAAFCKMVAEDFFNERWAHLGQESGQDMGQPTRPSPSPFTSGLTKYGHWIRAIPEPNELLSCLDIQIHVDAWLLELPVKESEYPTPEELLCHLFKLCHNPIQIDSLHLRPEDFSSQLWRTTAKDIVFHVKELVVEGSFHYNKVYSSELKYLLDRLSTTLQTLTFQTDIVYVEDHEEETVSEGWTFFKELKLLECHEASIEGSFWTWLWTRCGHVERLHTTLFGEADTRTLVHAMLTYMPHLDTIRLEQSDTGSQSRDDQVATILLGTRKGWKTVDASRTASFGRAALKVLAGHFPTLEELRVDGCRGITGHDLVQVLSSCPHLHTLIVMDDDIYSDNVEFATIQAESFIDEDPYTGELKAWSCETSLRVFKVRIGNIPRPDLDWSEDGMVDVYPNQGREMQKHVCRRLGRLINLETMWLGHDPQYDGAFEHYDEDRHYQMDCLELSLESGLDMLSRLNTLEELNVSRMKKSVRVEDFQWMTRHWAKLKRIYGLDRKNDDDETVLKWLETHCPRIKTPEVRDRRRRITWYDRNWNDLANDKDRELLR